MKYCSKCKKTKPLAEYWRNRSTKDGLQSYCKPCWYQTTTKKLNGPNREAELRKRKNSHLIKAFGITIAEYDKMVKKQKNLCAICLKPECGKSQYGTKKLAVDHCHVTGRVRGLLCEKCNRAIGQLHEDIEALERAIKYLKKSK